VIIFIVIVIINIITVVRTVAVPFAVAVLCFSFLQDPFCHFVFLCPLKFPLYHTYCSYHCILPSCFRSHKLSSVSAKPSHTLPVSLHPPYMTLSPPLLYPPFHQSPLCAQQHTPGNPSLCFFFPNPFPFNPVNVTLSTNQIEN
jgi:hypothetical protein